MVHFEQVFTNSVTTCFLLIFSFKLISRGGSRAVATSKMQRFVIIVIITKHSILDVAAVLDPPLIVWFLS